MKTCIATLALLLGTTLALEAQKAPAKPAPKAPVQAPDPEAQPRRPKAPKVKIQLNTAPKEAFLMLPGVDAAMAAKIVAGRPYLTKTNLVTRNIMPMALYDTIRHRLSASEPMAAK